MTGVNAEEGREEVNTSKKDESVLYNELISGFSNDYILSLDTTKKNSLIDDIMKKDVIVGSDIEIELKKYMASDSKEEFTGLDLSRINIYQLRKKVSGGFLRLKKKKEDFKTEVLSRCDISEKEYSQKISGNMDSISENDIKKLLGSENDRQNFLDARMGKSVVKRESLKLISTLSKQEVSKRLGRIASPEKEEIIRILQKSQDTLKLDDTDIQILIRSGFLNSNETKEFVETFIPYLTLQRAVDLGFITNSSAIKKRDVLLQKILTDQGISLSSDAELEFQSGLSLREINVATKDISLNDSDIQKISREVGFKNFENNSREAAEQMKEEFRNKGPATFDLMRQGIMELQNPNIQGIEKLREGSYILFSQKNESGEGTDRQYLKIVSIDDEGRNFSFQNTGYNAINLSTNSRIETTDYALFLGNLQKTQKSLQVFSGDEIRDQISSGNIESSELQSYRIEDFEGDDNILRREAVQQKHQEMFEIQIEELEQKLERSSKDSSIRKSLVQKQLDYKRKELNELNNQSLLPKEIAKLATFHNLLSRLDAVDGDGKKLGLKKGMSVETKENAFIIDGIDIDNEEITLNGLSNHFEIVSFSEFETAFKSQKAKRVEGLESVNAFIERISGPLEWGETTFENGELTAKKVDHKGQKPDQKIEYLVGTDSDTLVKIIDITDGYVEIQRGEIEDTKEKKGKQELKGHKLKIKGAKIEKYSLNEFAKFIESAKLKSDWKLGRTGLEVAPDEIHNDIKKQGLGSYAYSFFINDRLSISGLMTAFKSIHESLEDSLTKGGDLDAARFALKIGKILPKELQQDLLIKVEQKESESMDKELESLGKVDSWMAVERIEGWLLDTTTPEYKKEAGMLFMMSKYGHLTSKTALYKYRGKWLWYEAMGGRKNDELFLKIKAEAAADNQVFSEEFLLHMLMKKQCAGVHYSGIKRRSRIHKEYENKWKSGVEEEFEKGYKDASNKRTAKTMVAEGMGEALGGTTTNAIGWAKKAVERGGSLEDMMEISFCLMFSGAAFDVDQSTYLKMKGLWDGEGQPIVSQRMMSSVPEMKLFNNTVLELSKEIAKPENYGGQYGGIYEDAQEMFHRAENREKNGEKYGEPKRLKDSMKFWHKYGEVLSRGLNVSMQPDEKFSKTDTIIKRKKGENSIFREYYEKVGGYVEESDNTFKADFVEDAIGDTGVFGLNTYKISKKFLEIAQGGTFKKGTAGERVWKRIRGDINSTPGKILEGGTLIDSPENRIAQRDYIATQLKEVSAGLLAAHGGNKTALTALNNPTSLIGSQLNNWGINIQNDFGLSSAEGIKSGEKKKFFLQIADNIINGGASAEMGINNGSTPVEMLKEAIIDKASQVVAPSENLYG